MHKQLRLFLVVDGIYALAFGMLGPIYAVFVQQIGGDILEAGTAWAIFMISSGIGIFLMGKLQDRISKDKLFLVVGYAMRSLGFLGYYFVSNVTQMFVLQVFLGLAVMVISPATYSFYAKHVDTKKLASQWAAWEGTWYLVQGIAALIGSFLASLYGFKTLFLVMFIASLFSLAIATQLKEEPKNLQVKKKTIKNES